MYCFYSPELRENPGFETIDFPNKNIISILKKNPLILRTNFLKNNNMSKNNFVRKINANQKYVFKK